jgi:hypothetical protein
MSSETIAWAKEQACGNPVTKAVLMEIANWARPNGVCEYLSVKRIAEVVEVSMRTVQRHIALLESPDATRGGLGLIRRIERYRENGGQDANCFELVGYQPPLSLGARPCGNLTPPHDNLSPPPDKLTGAPLTNCHRPPDTRVRGKNININIPPSSPYGDETPTPDFPDFPDEAGRDDQRTAETALPDMPEGAAGGRGGQEPKPEGLPDAPPETRERERHSAPAPDDAITFDDFVEAWNEVAEACGLARLCKPTEARKRAFRARLREYPAIADWQAAFRCLRQTRWMHGDNPRGWRADPDFFLQAKSFTKLVEGQYGQADR